MERYNEYKNSGVQWLGEIPSHWACMSLLYALRSKICDGPHETPNYIDTGIPFISIDSLNDSDHIDFTNVRRFISEEDYQRYCQKTVIEKNDILFSKAATIGKTAIVGDEKFMVWSPLAVLKPSSKFIITRYLYHLLCNKKVIDDVSLSGSESTQINVGMRELEKLRIPVPTLPEQQAIASYLDEATSKIDAAIAQQQKMIDLLNERKQIVINNAVTKGLNPNAKMKDSGVDWIGEIPESWEVKKAKLCVTISNGSDPKTEGNIPVYGSGASSFRTCGEYKEGPCVLIGRKGATLHIPHYIQGRYWNVDTAFDVKTKNGIQLKYYYYLATCFDYPYYMSQTTLPSMTSFDYNRMKLPLPPEAEQKDIIDKLEQKLFVFDNAISSIEKQISLLQERKQIIINEVVTGKVKVCNNG